MLITEDWEEIFLPYMERCFVCLKSIWSYQSIDEMCWDKYEVTGHYKPCIEHYWREDNFSDWVDGDRSNINEFIG